jgi:hypothetical protein
MKILKQLPVIKNKNILKATVLATTLVLSPLVIAKAQNQYSFETKNTVETIDKTSTNKKSVESMTTKEILEEFDSMVTVSTEELYPEEKNSKVKKFFAILGAAIGLVGTALLCAWEPGNKKKPKS